MNPKIFQIGPHRVKHGSITEGIDDLMQGQQVDLIYTDPPWGQGNIRYWQTKNVKDTGAKREELDYNEFINMLFAVYQRYAKDILFVEYGIRWRQDIIDLGVKSGFQHTALIPLQYKSGSKLLPLDLHVFSKSGWKPTQEHIDSVANTYGLDTLKLALKPLLAPGKTILDPMCGMGYTAQIAKDNGMVFYGNELNRKRLQKTIDRLEK